MIDPADFLTSVRRQGIDYFVGVPDSLLRDLCAYIDDNVSRERHVIAANEGNAIGLATGWYLGRGQPALVYMQNSGIGNSINPLISLADPEVYSIPMLLVVGWRGAPGEKDEPQHSKQGRIMLSLLSALEVPCFIMDDTMDDSTELVSEACDAMCRRETPVVILVKPKTFRRYTPMIEVTERYPLSREEAIKVIVDCLNSNDLVVSTTGKASRELYERRKVTGDGTCRDFLTVGSMGHASSIAMAISSALSDKRVICLDGDGSAIMHMGSMAIIGQKAGNNLIHIVLNNGAHESVGGQSTVGFGIDFAGIAKSCGYNSAVSVCDVDSISKAVTQTCDTSGPTFIEIRVNIKSREDLSRPNESPIHNRRRFMTACGSTR